MKNKSVVMNILVFASFLLILLLLVVIFSLIKMIMPKSNKESKKTIITKNYTLDNIENISFNFKKANSNFEIIDGEELVIVQEHKEEVFYLDYKEKDKTIYLEEDSYLINPQKKNYTIFIPKKYKGKVTIINGFGEINESGIENDLYINNNAGSVNIKKSRNIRLKDVSGNINLEDLEGNLVAESSTGNISINNMIGIAKLESITGDITISNFDIIGDSYFENVSGDIVLDMIDDSVCMINASNERGKTLIDEKVCNGLIKINILNVKNVTGLIKIY